MLKENIETPDNNFLDDIESDFIKHAIENSKELTIFLVNGIKLEGNIIAFGNNSFLLKRDENIQLVYKHSISTILPLDSTSFIG
ncbi:MAG: RNA chaperone Hfq [Rhizobiales bacterium TMED168]|nr:MAG: RNA chaperone Hfq [Rhizobiales bacterium TMED168]|tara:strand:+ start:71118 stop:71369 length:252 start_codon:yes stop_codon:yes gene_type:complete